MARPKRTVLVMEPDEQLLAVYVFALLTNGFRVVGVQTAEQAKDAVEHHGVEAALILGDFPVELPIPIARSKSMGAALAAIRIALARKRGPPKGYKQKPKLQPSVFAEAVLARA